MFTCHSSAQFLTLGSCTSQLHPLIYFPQASSKKAVVVPFLHASGTYYIFISFCLILMLNIFFSIISFLPFPVCTNFALPMNEMLWLFCLVNREFLNEQIQLGTGPHCPF